MSTLHCSSQRRALICAQYNHSSNPCNPALPAAPDSLSSRLRQSLRPSCGGMRSLHAPVDAGRRRRRRAARGRIAPRRGAPATARRAAAPCRVHDAPDQPGALHPVVPRQAELEPQRRLWAAGKAARDYRGAAGRQGDNLPVLPVRAHHGKRCRQRRGSGAPPRVRHATGSHRARRGQACPSPSRPRPAGRPPSRLPDRPGRPGRARQGAPSRCGRREAACRARTRRRRAASGRTCRWSGRRPSRACARPLRQAGGGPSPRRRQRMPHRLPRSSRRRGGAERRRPPACPSSGMRTACRMQRGRSHRRSQGPAARPRPSRRRPGPECQSWASGRRPQLPHAARAGRRRCCRRRPSSTRRSQLAPRRPCRQGCHGRRPPGPAAPLSDLRYLVYLLPRVARRHAAPDVPPVLEAPQRQAHRPCRQQRL